MRILLSIAAILLLVPGWSGEARLELPRLPASLWIRAVPMEERDPARRPAPRPQRRPQPRRVGRLTWLGGWHLWSKDPAFGGYSAIAVRGDWFTLLGDGGNWLRFRFDSGHLAQATGGALTAGPGTGWDKADRDSESLAVDPRTGAAWIGFEGANAIGRFSSGLTRVEKLREPAAMRHWPTGGGAESLARLPDGRFVVLAELEKGAQGRGRRGLVFAGDPLTHDPAFSFTYLPPPGYDPSDAAVLPDGRVIVLNRGFRLPFSFPVIVTQIAADAFRRGAVVRGAEVARLERPLVSDNFEGIAATQEGGATILWIVSDDNQSRLQRTLLLKFRLGS